MIFGFQIKCRTITALQEVDSQERLVQILRSEILCRILKTLDDGTWKRRFPILKAMRTELQLSQKIIVATGILFQHFKNVER